MAKLDKLPVHVYEVDEEVDKDEVRLSLADLETGLVYRLYKIGWKITNI